MAAEGSWPSIRRHGLLSTAALADLFAVAEDRRDALLRRRRPASVRLSHPLHGRAVVRDQMPMSDAGLHGCLTDGLVPADWYALLNSRVFFALTRRRLRAMLTARPYRGAAHDVLEVDTRRLIAAYRDGITLAAINTGFTRRNAVPRGPGTLARIADYPYAAWRLKRGRGERVVELAVDHGIPDIAQFVTRVVSMRGDVEEAVLWPEPADQSWRSSR